MDARLAWYSVGASSTQLDAGSSSYSLLQSIYGSQASQLPLSDYESETNLITTQSEHHVLSQFSPIAKRRLSRPKSSPASVIAAREQLRSNATTQRQTQTQTRPGSALNRLQRPGSAARRIARGRPASAAIGRPTSAASGVRGGASPGRRRPSTAMGFRRPSMSSLSGSSTVLLDLEEEEEDVAAPIIRETPPVVLTHTPEYFDFWQGKPLRERDFGVKVHKRKAWQRPKSDYGTRFWNRNRNKENQNGSGSGVGGDGSGTGIGGLETLLERDGDSSLSSTRRGSRDFGRIGDGGDSDDKKSGLGDSSKLSISGEGLGSRRGSKDFGDGRDKDKRSLRDRSTSRTGGRHGKGGKQDTDKDSSGDRKQGDGSSDQDKSKWGQGNGAAAAEDDDYFKNSSEGYDKNSILLPAISTNPSVTAKDLHVDDTALHRNLFERNNKENKEAVNYICRERRVLKQLQPTGHLPSLTASSNEDNCYDNDSDGKALAALSWMDGVGSGSGNVTRFELPMDLKTLEGMSPIDYLNRHCIISKRRMAHCSKIFIKLDKKKHSKLNREAVKLGLVQVHHSCVTEEQVNSVLDLVELTGDTTVSQKLFAALCCFAERMLNLFFLPLAKKDVIETVDFEALDWKLRNVSVNAPLGLLFAQL